MDGMSRPSDEPNAALRHDRRAQLLLAREHAANRRRRARVTLRPPQTLPILVGEPIGGKLRIGAPGH